MFQVFFREIASLELERANDWYENKKKGLGNRFLDEIQNCLDRIKISPQSFAKQKGNYRQAVVKTFPFVILYRIDQDANSIIVLSIFHTKRNPKFKPRK